MRAFRCAFVRVEKEKDRPDPRYGRDDAEMPRDRIVSEEIAKRKMPGESAFASFHKYLLKQPARRELAPPVKSFARPRACCNDKIASRLCNGIYLDNKMRRD